MCVYVCVSERERKREGGRERKERDVSVVAREHMCVGSSERGRERERGKERKEKNVSVLHANTCVRVYACVCMRDCV